MVEDNIIGSLGCGEGIITNDNDVVIEKEADPGT